MVQKWAWPQNPPQSLTEFWVACQVLGVTCVLRILLRWLTLPRLLVWLTPTREISKPDLKTFASGIRWVNGILGRFPSNPRGSCLVRSLTLYYLGRRCGYSVQFHCGVRRAEGILTGHAWLSMNGEPILESADPRGINVVTYSYPSIGGNEGSPGSVDQDFGVARRRSNPIEKRGRGWPVEPPVGVDLKER